MADLIQTGNDWLAEQMQAYASQPVTYSRGDDDIELLATAEPPTQELDAAGGAIIDALAIAFVVQAADLVIDDTTIKPQRGDVIVFGPRTFGVVEPGPGEPPWSYADPYRKLMRIHARELN